MKKAHQGSQRHLLWVDNGLFRDVVEREREIQMSWWNSFLEDAEVFRVLIPHLGHYANTIFSKKLAVTAKAMKRRFFERRSRKGKFESRNLIYMNELRGLSLALFRMQSSNSKNRAVLTSNDPEQSPVVGGFCTVNSTMTWSALPSKRIFIDIS